MGRIDAKKFLSDMGRDAKPSAIREILKLTQKTDVISFAGGLPNEETFPSGAMREICAKVIEEHPVQAFQYGITEGLSELREEILEFKKGEISAGMENIIITHGSQQGLDLIGKAILGKGASVIIGAPSYLGAISSFELFKTDFITADLDENGIKTDELDEKLEREKGKKNIKALYTVPTFQNPTGITMSRKRRKELYNLACQHDFLIIEDNPYGELRYEGEEIEPIKAMDDEGRVIYLGSFSKVFVPSLRIAYMIAEENLLRKMTIIKQSSDLCTNVFGQFLAWEYLKSGRMKKQIEFNRKLYRRKRDIMLGALEKHFPDYAEWSKPQGGMFMWIRINSDKIDTTKMLHDAVENRVAYVPGHAFYVEEGRGRDSMRINFSNPEDEEIEPAVERLAEVVKKHVLE